MKTKTNGKNVKRIPIKDIHPNVKNPRKKYDKVDLEELKESMQSMGQLTPLIVDEKTILLAGHRRLIAAKELGWSHINCDVRKGLSLFEKSAVLVSSNTTQKQFAAWENREAIYDMYYNEFCEEYEFRNENDKGYQAFAKMMGVSSTTIRKVIESMSGKNKSLSLQLKKADIDPSTADEILSVREGLKKPLINEIIRFKKQCDNKKKYANDETIRKHIREKARQLRRKWRVEASNELHPTVINLITNRCVTLKEELMPIIMTKADINQKLDLIKALKPIVLFYNKLNKVKDKKKSVFDVHI